VSGFTETATAGPLLLALAVSVLAGLVSFASPCVVPLVPGYLSYLAAVVGVDETGGAAPNARWRVAGSAALFVAGFTVVFLLGTVAVLGMTTSLIANQVVLQRVGGAITIVMGLVFVGYVPALQRQFRFAPRQLSTLAGAPLLGAVFALAGMGKQLGLVATDYLPLGQPFEAVAAYCIGMALFTVVMGNAFAAFPVMTAAIGLPLIVGRFHGDPVIMGAIGMLCGYCGTLVTPMAANFNIVPAALLELPDRNGVIKAQIPTAIPLLIGNIVLMYALVFRY